VGFHFKYTFASTLISTFAFAKGMKLEGCESEPHSEVLNDEAKISVVRAIKSRLSPAIAAETNARAVPCRT
jgi:hypothetical protein